MMANELFDPASSALWAPKTVTEPELSDTAKVFQAFYESAWQDHFNGNYEEAAKKALLLLKKPV